MIHASTSENNSNTVHLRSINILFIFSTHIILLLQMRILVQIPMQTPLLISFPRTRISIQICTRSSSFALLFLWECGPVYSAIALPRAWLCTLLNRCKSCGITLLSVPWLSILANSSASEPFSWQCSTRAQNSSTTLSIQLSLTLQLPNYDDRKSLAALCSCHKRYTVPSEPHWTQLSPGITYKGIRKQRYTK